MSKDIQSAEVPREGRAGSEQDPAKLCLAVNGELRVRRAVAAHRRLLVTPGPALYRIRADGLKGSTLEEKGKEIRDLFPECSFWYEDFVPGDVIIGFEDRECGQRAHADRKNHPCPLRRFIASKESGGWAFQDIKEKLTFSLHGPAELKEAGFIQLGKLLQADPKVESVREVGPVLYVISYDVESVQYIYKEYQGKQLQVGKPPRQVTVTAKPDPACMVDFLCESCGEKGHVRAACPEFSNGLQIAGETVLTTVHAKVLQQCSGATRALLANTVGRVRPAFFVRLYFPNEKARLDGIQAIAKAEDHIRDMIFEMVPTSGEAAVGCHNCGMKGHKRHNCVRTHVCSKCHRLGHSHPACPARDGFAKKDSAPSAPAVSEILAAGSGAKAASDQDKQAGTSPSSESASEQKSSEEDWQKVPPRGKGRGGGKGQAGLESDSPVVASDKELQMASLSALQARHEEHHTTMEKARHEWDKLEESPEKEALGCSAEEAEKLWYQESELDVVTAMGAARIGGEVQAIKGDGRCLASAIFAQYQLLPPKKRPVQLRTAHELHLQIVKRLEDKWVQCKKEASSKKGNQQQLQCLQPFSGLFPGKTVKETIAAVDASLMEVKAKPASWNNPWWDLFPEVAAELLQAVVVIIQSDGSILRLQSEGGDPTWVAVLSYRMLEGREHYDHVSFGGKLLSLGKFRKIGEEFGMFNATRVSLVPAVDMREAVARLRKCQKCARVSPENWDVHVNPFL